MLNSRLFEIYFLRIKSYFKNFLPLFFNNSNYRILWLEQLLLSVIIGTLFHSVTVFCLMDLGLSWALARPKGPLCIIYVLCLMWGLMAMFVVYYLSGWGWAVAWGMFIFVCGLGTHFRDLKQSLNEVNFYQKPIEYEQNWVWGRHNLN